MAMKNIVSEKCSSDRDRMLQAVKCVVAANSAVYISGPITTGKNFVRWYLAEGMNLAKGSPEYAAAFRTKVLKVNEFEILDLAKRIRFSDKEVVIEPASLYIPEWNQVDYINYWIEIIENFVGKIILVDGWQFSLGCVKEFSFAAIRNYQIFSHDGQAISHDCGKEMVLAAAREVKEVSAKNKTLFTLAENLHASVMDKV